MSEALQQAAAPRHRWLDALIASPEEAFADFIAGYAPISPYTRADSPDAARMMIGHLPADDPARTAMATGAMAWLEAKRIARMPSDPPQQQNFVRQVLETFEIVSLLSLADPAVQLRAQYVRWFDWASRLNIAPSRDPRGSYLRMVASTQILVKDRVADPDGLAPFWMSICRDSGSAYPKNYLQIGLLGLRRLPGAIGRGESPWIAGLAAWHMAQRPTDREFLQAWLPIKRTHPASPDVAKTRVFNVLSQKPFKDGGITPPGPWASDADFPQVQNTQGRANALQPPPITLHEHLIAEIKSNQAFNKLANSLQNLIQQHERYADKTGDIYYLVRSLCSVGKELLRNTPDCIAERAQHAEQLARITLRYEPLNLNAWGLWRDALFSAGDNESAIAVGWEAIKRLPDDPLKRNELAEILLALDRVSEALEIVEAAIADQVVNERSYAILARIKSSRGDAAGARQALVAGLAIAPDNGPLLNYVSNLDRGKALTLVAQARKRVTDALARRADDPTLQEVTRSGHLRSLRSRLASETAAKAELQSILTADPGFGYAQILAARQGLWHVSNQALPPFAAAFEAALAANDLASLNALAEQMPRLQSLILLACAILGDPAAAEAVAERLRTPGAADDKQAIDILKNRFKPVFELIEGGLSASDAVSKCADHLRRAIYDANEAIAAPVLLAA